MQQKAALVNSLPSYRVRRMSFCGAPMPDLVTESGGRISGARYHCTDRYCERCARDRAQRAYACTLRNIGSTIEQAPALRLVTLTIRKVAWRDTDVATLSADLASAIERLAAVQDRCHWRLRRHEYAISRAQHHGRLAKIQKQIWWEQEARAQLPAVAWSTAGAVPDYSARYGLAGPTLGKTTYIWAREITTGASDAPGWHVHVHYLVPSDADAARLVSAWMAAARDCGERASISAQRVSQIERAQWTREDDAPGADAASYITKYVTKNDVPTSGESETRAYIYGTHGLRQYDAGGLWRPLGIGKRSRSEDRVVGVEWPDITVSESGSLSVETKRESVRDVMSGAAGYWRRAGALNQYRTSLTNAKNATYLLGALAISQALERPGDEISADLRQRLETFVEKVLTPR